MNSNLTALVDADNFYVSCERIFRPGLRDQPVVVLSNNDGCVVARSREVKDMGVKMGTPYYQIRDLAKREKIIAFSSNYELYGDISDRLMKILAGFAAHCEIYSIDEAFVQLDAEKAAQLCRQITRTCQASLSIPVKIGVSHTKTLAKVAAHLVKQENRPVRHKLLLNQTQIDDALVSLELGDVWGIGHKTAAKLERYGIRTPLDLKNQPESYVRKMFGVVLARTVMELRGVTCFELENQPQPKKNLCYSKSFARTITDWQGMHEAVTAYATAAAAKLRKQEQKAQSVSVFIQTDRFKKTAPQYANSASLALPLPANNTLTVVKCAAKVLERIFKPGYEYKKCGVLLHDLIPAAQVQEDLFLAEAPRNKAISTAMDAINARYGAETVVLAASGIKQQHWRMARKYLSARYTTQWNELIRVQ